MNIDQVQDYVKMENSISLAFSGACEYRLARNI